MDTRVFIRQEKIKLFLRGMREIWFCEKRLCFSTQLSLFARWCASLNHPKADLPPLAGANILIFTTYQSSHRTWTPLILLSWLIPQDAHQLLLQFLFCLKILLLSICPVTRCFHLLYRPREFSVDLMSRKERTPLLAYPRPIASSTWPVANLSLSCPIVVVWHCHYFTGQNKHARKFYTGVATGCGNWVAV